MSRLDQLVDLLKLFDTMDEEEKEVKDSWKVGPASDRKKIYLDFDDPALVKRKIDNSIGASVYYESLQLKGKDDGELDEIEGARLDRFEKFLERATKDDKEGDDNDE